MHTPSLDYDAHIKTYHEHRNPFVLMSYSPKLRGRARQYGSGYGAFRVILTSDGQRPPSVKAKTVLRVIADTGAIAVGSTERSDGYRAMKQLEEMTKHLNRLHHHKMGWRHITIREIDQETNLESQRELIEAIGGMERYARRAKFVPLQSDDAGVLMERKTATESIRIVAVTCPSTGRRYTLRVPPDIQTAHAGVAWTFGVSPDDYHPSVQT